MPVSFLTEAERVRLSRFPIEVTPADLISFFTLSSFDQEQIPMASAAYNRLGFALQLCTLRYLGFCPDDLMSTPVSVVSYVAQQIGVAPEDLMAYGERDQTRTDHLQQIQSYLGFRKASADDFEELSEWLLARALEHDRPTLLFQMACERLRTSKIVRLGVTQLEKMVATARQQAHQETFRLLFSQLTDERRTLLDRLLVIDPTTGLTPLSWLRQGAIVSNPGTILDALNKLACLRQWGISQWDLSMLTPNRRKFLAQLGKRSSNQSLERMADERRYSILIAFLHQIHEEVIDETIDLYDRYLADCYARARQELMEFRLRIARSANEKVQLLHELVSIVLNTEVTDEQVRTMIYQQIPPDTLRSALEECKQIVRPREDHYFDLLAQRYGHLRRFAPTFLQTFHFRSNQPTDPLLQAVELLRQLNVGHRRKIPQEAPTEFIPTMWRSYVLDHEGPMERRYYELCVLWELRAALRSGDVWIEGSRRYANPETYLIPSDRWSTLRPEACQLLGTPADGRERFAHRQAELESLLVKLDRDLASEGPVRMEDRTLVITPLKTEERPATTVELEKLVSARLPPIELADLLIEVDHWTGFSQYFEHAAGSEPRSKDLLPHCYASLIAQSCNFGLTTMAQIADLSYVRLAWYTAWYLREETLRRANAAIVNFQYGQALSRYWGGGTLSSSDGQRFPAAVKTRNAHALPRYFGYGRGLTFYTWTSDQFSQYGTKVIPSTVRDATYVLDEILDNETELPILEHTTDTSGYTDLVFALFDLLGLQFSPRLRDLADQRLYRTNPALKYSQLEPLLRGKIHPDLILHHWDDLLRVAASLKLGWVTASLLIAKLQSFPRQNMLTRALQEYGRLIKTIFILRYLDNADYRRRISRQLYKGEALHSLRRFLFVAHEGQIRRRHLDEQLHQASCLNLVTNAVIAWNTVYLTAALEQLKSEGYPVQEADIAHLSPARHEHINPYGKYRFDVDQIFEGLRPLRPTQRANL